jgi:hypothetical protein
MCIHYTRNIKIKCNECDGNECDAFYDCHKCHNDKIQNHEYKREDLKTVLCNACNHEQIPTIDNTCRNCAAKYSEYACIKCSYFGSEKTVHCDICCICRIEPAAHRCILNLISEKCSICLMSLMSKNYTTINCSHTFHIDCLFGYTRACETPCCPLCRQSFGNPTVFCNYCKETFYGCPRGTRLNCGHYYHMKCIKHLPGEYNKNIPISVECCKSDCMRIHYVKINPS